MQRSTKTKRDLLRKGFRHEIGKSLRSRSEDNTH